MLSLGVAMKFNYGNLEDINNVKSYEDYEESEIVAMVEYATNNMSEYEYDCLIDSLYLKQRTTNRLDSKNTREYSYHTAQSLAKKEKRESSLEALQEFEYVQFGNK